MRSKASDAAAQEVAVTEHRLVPVEEPVFRASNP
jgi:hypothetical protein